MPLAINWNSKNAIKYEKKNNPQKRNLWKASPKNKQISIKIAQKHATCKSSKKLQFHKKQAQIHRKTAWLPTLVQCHWHALGTEWSVFYCRREHWVNVPLSLFAAQYSNFTCLWIWLLSFSQAFGDPKYFTWLWIKWK